MTIEDLRAHGVLLPEEEWGAHRLESTTRELPLLAVFGLAAAALGTAYVGNGGPWTWVGVGVFLACLAGITWLCDRAVLRQRRRVRRERSRGPGTASRPGGPRGGDAGGPPGSGGAPGSEGAPADDGGPGEGTRR